MCIKQQHVTGYCRIWAITVCYLDVQGAVEKKLGEVISFCGYFGK